MSFPKMEFEESPTLDFDSMIKEEDDSQSRLQDEEQKMNNNLMLIKLKIAKVDTLIRDYNDKMKENEVLMEQIASLKEEKKRFTEKHNSTQEKYNMAQEKVTRLEMTTAEDKKSLQMLKRENKSQSLKLDENDKRMGQLQSRINELDSQKSTLEDKVKTLEKEVKSAKSKAAVKKLSVKQQGSQTDDPPKQDVSIVIKSPDVKDFSTNTDESFLRDEEPFPFYCSKCKHNIEPAPVDQILQTMSACPPLMSEAISPPVSPRFYTPDVRQHFSTKVDRTTSRVRSNDADFGRPIPGRLVTHPLSQDHPSFMDFDRLTKKMEKLEKFIRKRTKQLGCCSSKPINLTLNIPRHENVQNNAKFVKRKFANFNVSPKKKLTKVNTSIQKVPREVDWDVTDSPETKKRKSNLSSGQISIAKKRRLTSQQKNDLFETPEITLADRTCGDNDSEKLDVSSSPCSQESSQTPSATPKMPSTNSTRSEDGSQQCTTSKSLPVVTRGSNSRSSLRNNLRGAKKSVPNQVSSQKSDPGQRRRNLATSSPMDRKTLPSRKENLPLKASTLNVEVHQEKKSTSTLPIELKEPDVPQKQDTAQNLPTRSKSQPDSQNPELKIRTPLSRLSDAEEPSPKFDDDESIASPTLVIAEPSNDDSPSQDLHSPLKVPSKDTKTKDDQDQNSSTVAIESESFQVEDASSNQILVTSSPLPQQTSVEDSPLELPADVSKSTTDVPKTEDITLKKTPSRRGKARTVRNARQRQTRSTSSTPKNDENGPPLSSPASLGLKKDTSTGVTPIEDISPTRKLRNRGSKVTPTRNVMLRNTRKTVRSDDDCTSLTELSPSTKRPRVSSGRSRGSSTIKSPEIPAESEPIDKKEEEKIETPISPREASPDSTVLDLTPNLPDQKSTVTENLIKIDLTPEKSLSGIDKILPDDTSIQSVDCTSANQENSLINPFYLSREKVKEIDLETESIEKISQYVQNTSSTAENTPEPLPKIEPIEDISIFMTEDGEIPDTEDNTKLVEKMKKNPKKNANKNQILAEESAEPSQKVSKLIDESNSCLSNSGVVIELNNFISSQNDPSQKKKRRPNQKFLKKAENDMHEEIFSITEAEQWTSETNQKVVEKIVNAKDIKHPAHCIVEHITEKLTEDEDIDKTYTPPAPLMTRTEQQIVTLIVEVNKKCPEFIDLVTTGIQFKLFRLNAPPLMETVTERLSRIYVVLSKIRKDREKVRMFLCDAFYCLKMRAVNVLYVALQCWPEVLPKYDPSNKDIVLKAIIHSVMTITSKSPYHRLISLRKLIFTWYGYPNDQKYDKDTFKQEILENLQENSPGVNTAVLIFCKKNDPNWSLENIIWPLKQMIVSKIHPDPYEAFCLLGNLLRSFPPREYDSSIIEIIDQLCEILDAPVSADLAEGIVACLLSLSKYKFDGIARSVIKWDIKELRPVTKEKLKSLFRCHNAEWWSRFVSKNFPPQVKEEIPENAGL